MLTPMSLLAPPIAQPEVSGHANRARLAEHAALLESWLARGGRVPILWGSDRFAREVELVRTHLRPIASVESLGLSYGREHFHSVTNQKPPSSPLVMSRNATEVAYAIRWRELTENVEFGPWSTLISSEPAT